MSKLNIHFTLCHAIPERSFFWKGKQFPICSRCTGIHIGYLALPLFMFNIFNLNIWLSILFILPTCIDGLTQAIFNRESNNFLRVTSGFIAGIGGMSLASIIGKYIAHQILLILK